MLYKIGKKTFKILAEILQFVRVVLVFLSFFTVLYWILQLANSTSIAPVAPFFEGIKNITHIFYHRTSVITGTPIDFSFLMATFTFLLIAWGLKFAVEFINTLDEQYDKTHEFLKKKTEEQFNKQLEIERQKFENLNNKFLFLIKFNAVNAKRDTMYDRNVNEGVSTKENEILFNFIEFIEEEFDCKKEVMQNGLLLFFDNIENVDWTIKRLISGVYNLQRKFADEGWLVNYICTIDTFAKDNEKQQKIENLTGLANLGMENEILCLATFKERYSMLKTKNYSIQEKGNYQILDDLQGVFCIKSSK